MYLKNPLLRGIDDEDIEYEEWQIDELRKCAKDPIYFILKYIKIVDGDKGLINFQPRDYALEFIRTIHQNNYVVAKYPRQSGKSLSVAAYMTWYVIFNSQKNALLLAHKKSMASEQLLRIKNMIQEVPIWMQQPILKWNESSIAFANGSRVACSATTPNAARGFTINFLYLDEFAFVEPHIANEFIASVFPIVSSMETAKVIATSTPNGLNHFWKIWTEATNKIKSGVPLNKKDWNVLEIAWNAVPGRNDEWRKTEIEKIGQIRFAQEYMCEFLGSVATLVDAKFMKDIKSVDPIKLLDKNRLRIYEYPLPNSEMMEKNYEYLVTVDPAMGTHQDYTVAQVWKIESNTSIKQVAVYESNDVVPKAFIEKAYSLAKIYNDAGIIVETMEQAGGVIVNGLHYDKNYPNLIHMNEKGLGFNLSHDRKIEACVFLQVYMEKALLSIVDSRTLMELSTFGKKGNSYKALGDANDDLVTSILSMLYYVNSPYFYGNIDDEPIYKKKSIAHEFGGFDEVSDDPSIKELFERLHQEPVDEEYNLPMFVNMNNKPLSNTYHSYNKSPYENYAVYSYEDDID